MWIEHTPNKTHDTIVWVGVDHFTAENVSEIIKQKPGCPELPRRYKKIHSGKVRETYQHPDSDSLLIMIATDRISTHDVIHHALVPGKWKTLTRMSNFWFDNFSKHPDTWDIPNQLASPKIKFPEDFPIEYREQAVIAKKMKPLPVEAIMRWYLYGSALEWYDSKTWKLATWQFVWKGLQKCSKFGKPLFTPSTKSDDWDENVDFNQMIKTLDVWLQENWYGHFDPLTLANQVKDYSERLYQRANQVSQEKWLILWDTKFEFGLDVNGKLALIDEVCTADSSRLWTASSVIEWGKPEAHDKQPVRDYVIAYWRDNADEQGKYYWEEWFKKYPVEIPVEILENCSNRYDDVDRRIQSSL